MGRVIVITGTSSGIGAELKKRFAAAGDTVIGLCRRPDEGDIRCDVSDEAQVKAALTKLPRGTAA